MKYIKYRIWDTHSKVWLDPALFAIRANDGKVIRIGSVGTIGGIELVQYTGLKDKNDVEIYEGDIIAFEHEDGVLHPNNNAPVTFEYGEFFRVNDSLHHFTCSGNYIIVGNIYENPELLCE